MSKQATVQETLDAIIAEASAFSEFDVRTDDAFRHIVGWAHYIERRLKSSK